jgi:Bacterial transglutaminase-like N-terminal region
MLRPRESRDLRLMSHTLAITPAPVLTWAHDVFGNAVATATFATMADMVVIDSVADILLNTAPWPVFDIAASAISYPFRYSDDEWTDLGALAIEQYSNQAGRLRIWARGFIRSNPTDTLSLLKDLSLGVAQRISYQSREVEGSQPVGSLRCDFPVSENRRHSRRLGWCMASLTGISQVLVLGFGELAVPVSARHFSISVSTCHRPVR